MSDNEAIRVIRESLKIMSNAMQGGKGKVYVELDDPDMANQAISHLSNIRDVEIVGMTFPDQRLACQCLGHDPGLVGEEKYALKDVACPMNFLEGLCEAAIVDFIYTDSSIEDLRAALSLYDMGVTNVF